MRFLLAVTILNSLAFGVHEAASCYILDEEVNVQYIQPWRFRYDVGDDVEITCFDNYVISSATSEEENSAGIRCGAAGDWLTFGLGFRTVTGCVECIAGTVDCTGGTCEDGLCVCDDGYEKSLENPRLCTTIQCDALTLSNQKADSDGPYDVDTIVTVTCRADRGYHVYGTEADTEQVLTCRGDGHFDTILRPCVVCGDSGDCTNGICNANNECECDEVNGYNLSVNDWRVCE